MFGSTPPLCRPSRFLVLAILLVWAIVAMPAAGAQTGVTVVVPDELTARDALALAVTGVADPITVTITDSAAGAAVWSFGEDPAAERLLDVDLATPHSGAEPVNGAATVVVATDAATLHEAQVLLDRDPSAPALQVTATGRGVDATWDAVAGPGVVTYRLERAAGSGTWSTLLDAPGVSAFADRALEPGSYRYRLTASVAGARNASNSAVPSVATVAIDEADRPAPDDDRPAPDDDRPAPDDESPAGDTPPAAGDKPERASGGGTSRGAKDRGDAEARVRSRRVAAAGAVTRGIKEKRRKPAPVRHHARGPALAGLRARSVVPRDAASPRVAPAVRPSSPTPSGIPWRTIEAAAVPPIAGGGLLSVSTAATADLSSAAVPVAVALLVLLVGCHATVWRRPPSRAVVDPR